MNAAQIAKDMRKLVEEADYSVRSASRRSISHRAPEIDTDNDSSMMDGTPVDKYLPLATKNWSKKKVFLRKGC